METNIQGKIVCLSGSTKFKEDFQKIIRDFTLRGAIVLAPNIFDHADVENLSDDQKEMLYQNHLKKIRMSDIVYVVDKNGHIGESTKKEIKYAEDLKIPIFYMEYADKNRPSYPYNPYSQEKSWEWLQDTGLILYINQILHAFGIAITISRDDFGNLVKVYPARVKYRGFEEKRIDISYTKITKYLKENAEDLEKDITEPYAPRTTVEIVDNTPISEETKNILNETIPNILEDITLTLTLDTDNDEIITGKYPREVLTSKLSALDKNVSILNILDIIKYINNNTNYSINIFRPLIDKYPDWFLLDNNIKVPFSDNIRCSVVTKDINWELIRGIHYIIKSNIITEYTPYETINILKKKELIEFCKKLLKGELEIKKVITE